MSIAWRRGFFRLWAAFSVFWLVGAAYLAFSDTGIPSITKDCSILLEFTLDATGKNLGPPDVQKCNAVWETERKRLIATTFVPPLATLILGMMAGWIASGFRKKQPNSN